MTSVADRQLEQWKARMEPLGRLPKEWVGKKPDSMPPATVRDRILRGWGSKCHISGVEIRPGSKWDADHIVSLANGGINAERNLAPALTKAHREKTRAENKARAAAAKQRRASTGNKAAPAQPINGPGFAERNKQAKATTPVVKKEIEAKAGPFDHLPRKAMFK